MIDGRKKKALYGVSHLTFDSFEELGCPARI